MEETAVSSFLFQPMPVSGEDETYRVRRERLANRLGEMKLESLIVTNPKNIFYLTGFRGTAGAAVLGADDGRLWVDPRYILQARSEAQSVEVLEERHGLLKAVGAWLKKVGGATLGFEDQHLTCADFEVLRRGSGGKVKFKGVRGMLEEVRSVKDPYEIGAIRLASDISCAAFEEVRDQIRPGAREADLAAEIEHQMRQKGAEGAAFETIVASGSRGAWPHARSSPKPLKRCELVIFDFGAIVSGYAADITRTVFLGLPDRRARTLYKAVLGAQEAALEALQVGVRGSEPDLAARRFLERKGLSRYFTHSTGHGVGLDIHELPRLAKDEKSRLAAGQVVTVEPGIYIEGFGGIRIEDTALVRETGAEILTRASKKDWIIA